MLIFNFKNRKSFYLGFMSIIVFLLSCDDKKNIESRRDLLVSTIYSSKLLVYTTLDSPKIVVEDLISKNIIFDKNLKETSFTEPKIKDDIVCFPDDNFTFVCYNYKTAKKLWSVKTFSRIREFQFVNKNLIIASIDNFGIIAINYLEGKIEYELQYKDPKSSLNMSPRPIQFDRNNFYVADWNGKTMTSLTISNGKVNWCKKITEGFTNFTISKDYIFFGSNDLYRKGNIGLLNIKNGDLLCLKNSFFENMMDPILYKNKVYYYTFDKKLNMFDLKSHQNQVVYNFNSKNDISQGQMYLLNNSLYFQDETFNVVKFNLITYKKEIVGVSKKGGINGVYFNSKNELIIL